MAFVSVSGKLAFHESMLASHGGTADKGTGHHTRDGVLLRCDHSYALASKLWQDKALDLEDCKWQ